MGRRKAEKWTLGQTCSSSFNNGIEEASERRSRKKVTLKVMHQSAVQENIKTFARYCPRDRAGGS
jgi:hypothetical protein